MLEDLRDKDGEKDKNPLFLSQKDNQRDLWFFSAHPKLRERETVVSYCPCSTPRSTGQEDRWTDEAAIWVLHKASLGLNRSYSEAAIT